MKILQFHFAELGGLGGVDVVVTTLSSQFAQRGHETGVLEIAKQYKPLRRLADGTPVWGVTVPSRLSARRPRSWASFGRSTLQLLKVVHEFNPDVIHVHFPLSQCLPVVGAYFMPHKWRLVVTLHNSDIRVAPLKDKNTRLWQDRLFARADAVTAVNQALLDDANALFSSIGNKGSVIVNGVGPQWFQPLQPVPNGNDYLLFAGRLNHIKGPDILLKAWGQIHKSFPQTQLWLAGEGEERGNLEGAARDLGIAASIRFIGRKNHQELISLYAHARAVVLPSRREGLPLTLLEAGAAGAICVGSRTPGIPEIIQDGITGYLTDTESVEALSSGMSKALSLSPERLLEMKSSSQRLISDRFSEQQMISNYLELFDSLSRKPARPAKKFAASNQ